MHQKCPVCWLYSYFWIKDKQSHMSTLKRCWYILRIFFFWCMPKEIEHSLAKVCIEVKWNKWSFIYLCKARHRVYCIIFSFILTLHYPLKLGPAYICLISDELCFEMAWCTSNIWRKTIALDLLDHSGNIWFKMKSFLNLKLRKTEKSHISQMHFATNHKLTTWGKVFCLL